MGCISLTGTTTKTHHMPFKMLFDIQTKLSIIMDNKPKQWSKTLQLEKHARPNNLAVC